MKYKIINNKQTIHPYENVDILFIPENQNEKDMIINATEAFQNYLINKFNVVEILNISYPYVSIKRPLEYLGISK